MNKYLYLEYNFKKITIMTNNDKDDKVDKNEKEIYNNINKDKVMGHVYGLRNRWLILDFMTKLL